MIRYVTLGKGIAIAAGLSLTNSGRGGYWSYRLAQEFGENLAYRPARKSRDDVFAREDDLIGPELLHRRLRPTRSLWGPWLDKGASGRCARVIHC